MYIKSVMLMLCNLKIIDYINEKVWHIKNQQCTYNCGLIACMSVMEKFRCLEYQIMDEVQSNLNLKLGGFNSIS